MSMQLIGIKKGMTRVYAEDGSVLPVTVIEVTPNVVTQVKEADGPDGYAAVQIGGGEMKARNSSIPMIGHDAKAGTAPKRNHLEFKSDESFELGQTLTVADLEGVKYVDVIGTTKGKGFQGVMKRHGFKGQLATHGVERKHRSPGSIVSGTNLGTSGKLKKGKKMSGHMGSVRRTIRSLDLVRIDAERNLVLVKGPVPGANGGTVVVRPAVRLNRSKAKQAGA